MHQFEEVECFIVKHFSEVGTEIVTGNIRAVGVARWQQYILQFIAAIGYDCVFHNVVGIGSDDLYLVFGNVGIDVAIVQDIVAVMLLLGHTQNASHGLNSKCGTLQLAEDEQHSGSWAVPAKGDCLFEQQHLCHIVWLFKVVEIAFRAGEPHGKATVFLCDVALLFEVGLDLLCHVIVFGSHRLFYVVWQLNKQ